MSVFVAEKRNVLGCNWPNLTLIQFKITLYFNLYQCVNHAFLSLKLCLCDNAVQIFFWITRKWQSNFQTSRSSNFFFFLEKRDVIILLWTSKGYPAEATRIIHLPSMMCSMRVNKKFLLLTDIELAPRDIKRRLQA